MIPSGLELIDGYRRRELSPVEVTRSVLERIDRVNPELNAFVTLTPDLALEAAREAERAYAEGRAGQLAGVPVSIKDLTPTKGVRTTWGSLLHEREVPDADAPFVARVRESGGVIIGKTATPEMGWKGETTSLVHGTTHNPWRHGRTAGGSSGGAAAAVAAGLGQLAQGGDGAGSIRIPAAFCGIAGLKTTRGLVPRFPPSGSALSVVGPMARTVADCALLLDATARTRTLAGLDEPVDGLRAAWSGDLGYAAVEPEVLGAVERAAHLLAEGAGLAIADDHPQLDDPWPFIDVIWAANQASHHAENFRQVRELLDPGRAEVVARGLTIPATAYVAAQDARAGYELAWDGFMAGYDLMLTPTVPVTAFLAGTDNPPMVAGRPVEYLSWTAFTYPFNATGQPAATVPCGLVDGLPVGLQIVGRRGEDALVLRAARAFERLCPWSYDEMECG
ncbi:MAG TPA: amidase family protein [Gaiellales bacterium]|nr:amidase family protein [Gaiellales bacterium]